MTYKDDKTLDTKQIKSALKGPLPLYQIGKSSPLIPKKIRILSAVLVGVCGGQRSE